jgi:hypothetical protein
MARGKCRFNESELARALRGATRAGTPAQSVDIRPDGTITMSFVREQKAKVGLPKRRTPRRDGRQERQHE